MIVEVEAVDCVFGMVRTVLLSDAQKASTWLRLRLRKRVKLRVEVTVGFLLIRLLPDLAAPKSPQQIR